MVLWLAQLDFTVGSLKPISEGHSFHYAGAPYKCLYGGAPYKSPKIVENRRKLPKIRASGRPPMVTRITTDRKIKLRRPRRAGTAVIPGDLRERTHGRGAARTVCTWHFGRACGIVFTVSHRYRCTPVPPTENYKSYFKNRMCSPVCH